MRNGKALGNRTKDTNYTVILPDYLFLKLRCRRRSARLRDRITVWIA
jgi:hypothetical protein